MSNFSDLKIRLYLSIGYPNASREDWEYLSDYWDEDTWNALTEKEKERWLDDFFLEWKSNYEEGRSWIVGDEE